MTSSPSQEPRRLAVRLTPDEVDRLRCGDGQRERGRQPSSGSDAPIEGSRHDSRYALLTDVLSPPDADAIERLVNTETEWKLNEKWFLSKYDVVWERNPLGQHQVHRTIPELETLRNFGATLIEERYNVVVGERFAIKGTKMLRGQRIGIHNDSPVGARGNTEGFRLLYYPNREFADSDGGHLVLFADDDESAIEDVVRPLHNTVVLMPLSNSSYHAVSSVKKGVRHTVALLYWDYPLLFDSDVERRIAAGCLRSMIAAGFEKMPHSGTTLAFHLYHTYRLLAEWGAPFSVCLAGLLNGVPGPGVSGSEPRGISRQEVETLVGDRAFRIIRGLERHSDAEAKSDDSGLEHEIRLVELANLLEQATDAESIAHGCKLLAEIASLEPGMTSRIEFDIEALRAEVACTVQR